MKSGSLLLDFIEAFFHRDTYAFVIFVRVRHCYAKDEKNINKWENSCFFSNITYDTIVKKSLLDGV